MLAALILFLVAFILGFMAGFTTYSILLGHAVRTGRAYLKDKFGHWNPKNPFRSEEPK